MTELSYHFRDKQGRIRKASPEEVGELVAHSDKPVILACLGRDGFSGKTEPEKQVNCIEGFFDGHKPSDVHVIAVTSAQRISDTKLTNYMLRFNGQEHGHAGDYEGEYHHPTSFGMQLLKDVIDPAIPYAGYTSDAEYEKLAKQAKLKCSQLNFFSHSFGGVVQAEMYDYMRDMLQNKGYYPDDIQDCLNAMGRVSVGSPYHITGDRCLVPGIDYNSALDRLTEKYNNVPQHSDSKAVAMERINDSIQLCPLIGDDFVNTVQLKATPEADEQEKRSFTSRYKPGAKKEEQKPSPWELIVGDRSDGNYHALQLYMYKDRTRLDPENGRAMTTSQAFPGADVANKFMLDLFESSQSATQTGTPRDTRKLIDELHTRLTPPAARDALGESLLRVKAGFERHFMR